MPAGKRRVLQYSGVVAWFCALKLHLYASYVLSYDDIFGVYEWGSGGIVHLHLLGWRYPGLGRYDCHEGRFPHGRGERRRGGGPARPGGETKGRRRVRQGRQPRRRE